MLTTSKVDLAIMSSLGTNDGVYWRLDRDGPKKALSVVPSYRLWLYMCTRAIIVDNFWQAVACMNSLYSYSFLYME